MKYIFDSAVTFSPSCMYSAFKNCYDVAVISRESCLQHLGFLEITPMGSVEININEVYII